jgi:hypothetical protein
MDYLIAVGVADIIVLNPDPSENPFSLFFYSEPPPIFPPSFPNANDYLDIFLESFSSVIF